jgi:Ca2+-binding RTX toxin-like protein
MAAVAVGLLGALVPAGAEAASTIGQSPPAGALQQACTSSGQVVDVAQFAAVTGNSYTIPPGGGVITSWSTSASNGSATIKFRAFTGNETSITPVGESAPETITPNSPKVFATRVPVSGGEFIGFAYDAVDAADCLGATPAAGDRILGAVSGPIGGNETVSTNATMLLTNVSANLEPDADKDGFGDETQDECPSSANTQESCRCAGRQATIVGTADGTKIKGTFGKDVIVALDGDDVVIGRGGNDILCGGDGRDELKGGDGKDKLFGDAGKDKLVGGGKSDTCNGGAAKDKSSGCEKGPDS